MGWTARWAIAAVVLSGCGGADRPVGVIEGQALPSTVVAARAASQQRSLGSLDSAAGSRKAILFGDLHVHTTFSIDAFLFSLPFFAGEGAHPPADACDFARYCAQLDFFSLNDHAEGITPEHWRDTKSSLRECNARAGDAADPDLVAFTGWEWTQVGPTPETHWGHKNVIFPGTAEDELPVRPIDSVPYEGQSDLFAAADFVGALRFVDPLGWLDYRDFQWMVRRLEETPRCEPGVDVRELPVECLESAPTPEVLFEKLDQWGFPALVIPHGSTWGMYTPPGTSMDKQLDPRQHDPERQRLVEVFSGHGNSEEYRPWRAVDFSEDGAASCPEPSDDFLPCCWRAGEIVRERCGELPEAECEARVEETRRLAVAAGARFPLVIPDARAEEWLDCDQCRDCFKPSAALRPRESVQYSMALSRPDSKDADGRPFRFRYGFISSSDNHAARPGTGYKQYERRIMTEASGVRSAFYDRLAMGIRTSGQEDPSQPVTPPPDRQGFLAFDVERVASFLYPGGLVAVHAEDRGREAIWRALERREVYGTSGPRLLLWFDLLDAGGSRRPMGSAVSQDTAPRFEVRAIGSFVQKHGCPPDVVGGLSAERLERLCRGECYNPGDVRNPIRAIEIVRIRPQQRPGEDVDALIEDPWRRFECEPDPAGCVVRFDDPEFPGLASDALYYARALQEPTPAINGANLRTRFDADGQPVSTDPCFGDHRTDFDEQCLAPVQERAWSSPIFVDRERAQVAVGGS